MGSLFTDDLFLNHVSQISSKSILKDLSNSETISETNWSYHEPYLQRNASTLSYMIEFIALENHKYLDDIKNSSLRLALLWENLSRLKESTPKGLALLNSAICYELAGYQANASCLSKKFQNDESFKKSNLELLISTFLQRLFVSLREKCEILTSESNFQKENPVESLGLALTASALINCTNFFISGSEKDLNVAKEKFKKAEDLYAKTKFFYESNLIYSVRSLLDVMHEKSTWTVLKDFRKDDFTWDRYLRLLSRGLGNNIFTSPSISEFWPSQIESIHKGLLSSEKSKIIRMPTSSGKTRIAELAIVNALTKNPSSKCIYIAPYRSLVSELEETFVSIFNDLGFHVSSILGYYENDPFESRLIDDSDLLITTPEKLDLLLRSRPEFFDEVSLFILDEGHIVNQKTRGLKIELLLTRLQRKFSHSRFLLLSAVLSDDTINEFLEWFNIQQDDLIKLNWKPTIKQHAKFEWTKTTDVGKISYVSRPENQLRKFYVSSIITHKKYSFENPKTRRTNTKIFPSTAKNETAAELGYKFSQLGPVLIFAPSPRLVTSIAKALKNRIEYSIKSEEEIPYHFRNNDCSSVKVAEEWLGKENEITLLLKQGIAIHYGDLPEILKRSIESDFRAKKFKVIVATNTLAQGVNFPIQTVIIHSCSRYEDNRQIPMSANEYWNLVGRAGRAGYETEGTVIHIIGNKSDEIDYNTYLKKENELEPTNGALFHLLVELINENITNFDIEHTIDPEILGILSEESSLEYFEDEIDAILDNSLASIQIKKYPQITMKPLSTMFKQVAKNIIESNPNKKLLKVYTNTGLSSSSCNYIHDFIQDHLDEIRQLFTEDDFQNIIPLTSLIFEVLNKLHEMTPRHLYAGDTMELLQLWMSGKNLSEIFELIEETDMYNVTKYIEEYFGYHSPWGISSFIQIAQHVLNISNDDLSHNIKYLPSMIKYGVPTPETSWVMQLGIPFKNIAISIANRFQTDNNTVDYGEFINWISKISNDELIHDFNLESTVLADVSKTLSRIGTNNFLKEKRNLESVLEEITSIKGIMYEHREIVASKIKIEDHIDVKRDYENMFDKNAIKLFFKGREIGFIDKHLAQYLSPMLDGGTKLSAKVTHVENLQIPKIQIKLNQE